MCRVIVFAGTTEGRKLSAFLEERQIPAMICVATEYGESVLEEYAQLEVHRGRMDQEDMRKLFEEKRPEVVIDATHPYAVEVTKNIRTACEKGGRTYIRVVRKSEEYKKYGKNIYVDSAAEAARYLSGTAGNIFLTTGSKELGAFTEIPDYEERVYARVLPAPEIISVCAKLGIRGKHVICMQGPFSEALNEAMFAQCHAAYVVTKESGTAGGFREKEQAAEQLGIPLVIIGRPKKEEGLSLEQCKEMLEKQFQEETDRRTKEMRDQSEKGRRRRVSLVGIGMGSAETMTGEASRICREADLLIGAKRMTEAVRQEGQQIFCAYRAEEILEYIKEHPQYENVAVVLSGDVGFFSGAKDFLGHVKEQEENLEVRVIPGISSLVYFCAKLHVPWEKVKAISAHGREEGLVSGVREHPMVFALAGGKNQIAELCKRLTAYGFGDCEIAVGERLSYPEERIFQGNVREFCELETDSLAVFLIWNRRAERREVVCGIPDEQFCRGKVPMTKEEVRSISISKLRLWKDAVIYDVGAGTGSVAVEMALQAPDGVVYAVEKNEEAVALLGKNRVAFAVDHLKIVHGKAPEALENLPAPTHVFLGGSSGNLKEILDIVRKKNKAVRVVINAITLETVTEALTYLKEQEISGAEVVSVQTARAREVGRYHMMTGQNPVYVISFGGERQER